MKKFLVLPIMLLMMLVSFPALAQDKGYAVGDEARDFTMTNINGEIVTLSEMTDAEGNPAKGHIVVFTCNTCPWAKLYEDRLIALSAKYLPLGYPVVAVNPNDPDRSPGDSFDAMVERADEKGFNFPYLVDETQEVTRTYGATKTPHLFVLEKVGDKRIVRFIGAIDDKPQSAESAQVKYVEEAVDQLLEGKAVSTPTSKAIGCTIKWKKS